MTLDRSMLQTLIIKDAAQFERLGTGWDALIEASARPHIHHTHEWQLQWWRQFGEGRDLRIGVVEKSGLPIGIVPLFLETRRGGPLGLIRWRTGAFLGLNLVDSADVVTDGSSESSAASVDFLLNMEGWHELDLRHFVTGSQTPAIINERGGSLGLNSTVERIDGSPFLPLSGSFDAYLTTLGTNWRQDSARQQRRVQKDMGAVELDVRHQVTSHDLQMLRDVAQRRRDAGDERRCPLLEPLRMAFIQSLCKPLNDRGWWQLALLKVGGTIAAYHLGFQMKGTFFCWSVAHDPDFSKYSPGKILMRLHIEHCFQAGMQEFDFMAGEEGYKSHWTDCRRHNQALRINRKNWRLKLVDLWAKARSHS
jgi:CelD/BcsL family acetyltransferase involved in cellulose biosynthesis